VLHWGMLWSHSPFHLQSKDLVQQLQDELLEVVSELQTVRKDRAGMGTSPAQRCRETCQPEDGEISPKPPYFPRPGSRSIRCPGDLDLGNCRQMEQNS
jgi:hypothetical protein